MFTGSGCFGGPQSVLVFCVLFCFVFCFFGCFGVLVSSVLVVHCSLSGWLMMRFFDSRGTLSYPQSRSLLAAEASQICLRQVSNADEFHHHISPSSACQVYLVLEALEVSERSTKRIEVDSISLKRYLFSAVDPTLEDRSKRADSRGCAPLESTEFTKRKHPFTSRNESIYGT